MAPQKTLTPAAFALMGTLALLWGGSFLSARLALDQIGPFWLVCLRCGLAAAVLWVVIALRREEAKPAPEPEPDKGKPVKLDEHQSFPVTVPHARHMFPTEITDRMRAALVVKLGGPPPEEAAHAKAPAASGH